jgi:hypothetical protein
MPPFTDIRGLVTNKPLSDPALPTTPLALNLPPQSSQISIPDPAQKMASLGSFNIAVGASTSLAVINSDSDPEPLGFFNRVKVASDSSPDAAGAPLVESPLKFDPSQAYVVVTGIAVSGKLSGNFTIGSAATLGLDGSTNLEASVCTAFPKDTPARDAIVAATTEFKTIFSIPDLLSGPPGAGPTFYTAQVLSFGVATDLAICLKIKAAGLAAALADSVNSVLNSAGPLAFQSSAGAAVSVTVNVMDGYRIFATRNGGATTFSVKKSLSKSLGLDGGIGLDIAVTDSALNGLVDSLIGQAVGTTEGAINKSLPTQGSALISGSLPSVQSKIAALKDDFIRRLVVTVRGEFAYTWKRLTTDSLVAQFTVPDAVLPKYHAQILALDLTSLMGAPASDGVVFSRLLGQTIQESDVGYGFSFSVGNHIFLKSWDSLQTKFAELDTLGADASVCRQFSFLGRRSYDATWMGTSYSQYLELDASTPRATSLPSSADFQVGLSIAFTWKNQKFGDVLAAVADHGALLATFDNDDVDAAQNALLAAGVPRDASGDAVVVLAVRDGVLSQLLPTLTGTDYLERIAPHAMARALPYAAAFPDRCRVDRRMSVYGQVWADFLSTENLADDTLSKICQMELPRVTAGGRVASNLLFAEASEANSWSVHRVAQMASAEDLQDAVLRQAPGSFSLLKERSVDFHQLFPEALAGLSTLAAQSYGSRVIASMFVLAAMINPGCLDRLGRSVQFTWIDGAVEKVVVVKVGGS